MSIAAGSQFGILRVAMSKNAAAVAPQTMTHTIHAACGPILLDGVRRVGQRRAGIRSDELDRDDANGGDERDDERVFDQRRALIVFHHGEEVVVHVVPFGSGRRGAERDPARGTLILCPPAVTGASRIGRPARVPARYRLDGGWGP